MKLSYLTLIQDNKLDVNSLPEDIQIGIKSIKGIERIINMKEKKGQKVADSIIKKIEREDRVVSQQITDHIEKGKKTTEPPAKVDPPKDPPSKTDLPMKKDDDDATKSKGYEIEKELEAAFKAGKTSFTLADLKKDCPLSYDVIFSGYEKDSEDNGLQTSHYQLLESKETKETFVLSKI